MRRRRRATSACHEVRWAWLPGPRKPDSDWPGSSLRSGTVDRVVRPQAEVASFGCTLTNGEQRTFLEGGHWRRIRQADLSAVRIARRLQHLARSGRPRARCGDTYLRRSFARDLRTMAGDERWVEAMPSEGDPFMHAHLATTTPSIGAYWAGRISCRRSSRARWLISRLPKCPA